MFQRLHHVAYRCRDAAETVDFYTNVIGLRHAASMLFEKVPSVGLPMPHIHIFFEMADSSCIAFFDLLDNPDPIVPVENDWAQHLALEVGTEEKAEAIARRLRDRGVKVLMHRHEGMATSYYFYDPNGHRLEMNVKHRDWDSSWAALGRAAQSNLDTWNERKRKAKTSTCNE
jgi:glyoxylase I family protein